MARPSSYKQSVRIPPQNIEAEMSVLGSLMLDKDAIYRVADFLHPKDFYKNEHNLIYETMLELFSKHIPIDMLSLTTRLKEKGHMESIGGHSYVASLVNTVPVVLLGLVK